MREMFKTAEKLGFNERRVCYDWNNKPQEKYGYKFKSKIERKWADYLQKLLEIGAILSWTYEPETFEFAERYRIRRQYTPDFYVQELDDYGNIERCYHEVKTSLRQTDIRRFRLMAADYPNITMVLVLPFCSNSSKQINLRFKAQKYVHRITYAQSLFRKFGIT